MNIEYVKPKAPTDEELKAIAIGLKQHNDSAAGEFHNEKVVALAKSPNGEIVGGAYGIIDWGWLYVDWLWCDKRARGQGVGSQLLANMEQHARDLGIARFRLQTTNFQALDFYKKQGYEVFAELADLPPGHTSYFLRKTEI